MTSDSTGGGFDWPQQQPEPEPTVRRAWRPDPPAPDVATKADLQQLRQDVDARRNVTIQTVARGYMAGDRKVRAEFHQAQRAALEAVAELLDEEHDRTKAMIGNLARAAENVQRASMAQMRQAADDLCGSLEKYAAGDTAFIWHSRTVHPFALSKDRLLAQLSAPPSARTGGDDWWQFFFN